MIELTVFGIMFGMLIYEAVYWKTLRSPDIGEIHQKLDKQIDFFRNAYLGFPFSSDWNMDYVRIKR